MKEKIHGLKSWDVENMKLVSAGKILKDDELFCGSNVKDKASGGFIVCMVSRAKVCDLHSFRTIS